MVILDVDSREGYAAGHIPGAFLLADEDTDLWTRRSNGFVTMDAQVPDRSQIDAVISRTNIDPGSVIVLTGRDLEVVGRAYFNFRYWGFTREQLKVLNGSNNSYAAAGFQLATSAPKKPEPCGFSVCNLKPELSINRTRATFQEMLTIAEDENPQTVIIDSRSPAEFMGTEETVSVAFDGHIRTAVNIEERLLLENGNSRNPLRSKGELISIMHADGVNESTTSYIYSGKDFSSAVAFLALDAVLRWPVKIYDGGWLQWGRMASIAKGGLLEEDSLWRTDIAIRSAGITYHNSQGFIKPESPESGVPQAEQADNINRIDSASCDSVEGSGTKSPRPQSPGY
jgi:3-mercaptopyruvate sulfurtransferase SseA